MTETGEARSAESAETRKSKDGAEIVKLRAQRDYYRRRWLIHGIRFPSWLFRREAYVAEAMDRLYDARKRDGDD